MVRLPCITHCLSFNVYSHTLRSSAAMSSKCQQNCHKGNGKCCLLHLPTGYEASIRDLYTGTNFKPFQWCFVETILYYYNFFYIFVCVILIYLHLLLQLLGKAPRNCTHRPGVYRNAWTPDMVNSVNSHQMQSFPEFAIFLEFTITLFCEIVIVKNANKDMTWTTCKLVFLVFQVNC